MAAGLMGRALPCGRAYWASWKIAMTQFSSRSTWPAQIHKPKCKNQTKNQTRPRRSPAPPPGCSRSWASWTSWTWWCGSWQLRSGYPNTCFCFLGSSNRTSCFDQGWGRTDQKLGLKSDSDLQIELTCICQNSQHIYQFMIFIFVGIIFTSACIQFSERKTMYSGINAREWP